MIIECNGQRLYVDIRGDERATPLILLHGNGEDHTIFDAAVQELQKHYRVILPDSRGHGQSQAVSAYDYDAMAEDMAAMIRVLKLEKPIFFGFSDGGIIGLLLAVRHSALLKRLIVAGANTNPKGLKAYVRLAMHINYFFTRDAKVHLMLTQPQIPAEMLGEICIPVRVLAGERDIVKTAHTHALCRSIPEAAVQILSGEDHAGYVVHSTKFIAPAGL